MGKPSGFTVVMGKGTPVSVGPVQKDPPSVVVADVSFMEDVLSINFWEAIKPRVIAGEGFCDVGHIAHELCDHLCPINGTIVLEVDGRRLSYLVNCERARGAA
jgi:hypothetical protein